MGTHIICRKIGTSSSCWWWHNFGSPEFWITATKIVAAVFRYWGNEAPLSTNVSPLGCYVVWTSGQGVIIYASEKSFYYCVDN